MRHRLDRGRHPEAGDRQRGPCVVGRVLGCRRRHRIRDDALDFKATVDTSSDRVAYYSLSATRGRENQVQGDTGRQSWRQLRAGSATTFWLLSGTLVATGDGSDLSPCLRPMGPESAYTKGEPMLSRMKLGNQVLAALGAALVVCLALGGAALLGNASLAGHIHQVAGERFPAIVGLLDMQDGLDATVRGLNVLQMERLPVAQRHEIAFPILERAERSLRSGREAFEAVPHTGAAAHMWTEVVPGYEQWLKLVATTRDLLAQRDALLATKAPADPAVEDLSSRSLEEWHATRKLWAVVAKGFTEVIEQTRSDVAASQAQAAQSVSSARFLIVIVILTGAVFVAILGLLIWPGDISLTAEDHS